MRHNRSASLVQCLTLRAFCFSFSDDGTLTPIVPVPSSATLSAETRSALSTVVTLYPTSILTGRSLPTISHFLNGVDSDMNGEEHTLHVAASHGYEILLDGLRAHLNGTSTRVKQVGVEYLPVLESFHHALRTELEQHPQLAAHLAAEALALENNRFCLSVHYRNLPAAVGSGLLASLDGVLDSLLAQAEYRQLKREFGKMVYEIKPRLGEESGMAFNSWHKGCAMDYLLNHVLYPNQRVTSSIAALLPDTSRRLQLDDGVELLPLYCGDDLTDEDCFRYMASLGLCANESLVLPALSVFVQGDKPLSSSSHHQTAANFTLRNPDEVHQLLEKLIQFAKE